MPKFDRENEGQGQVGEELDLRHSALNLRLICFRIVSTRQRMFLRERTRTAT